MASFLANRKGAGPLLTVVAAAAAAAQVFDLFARRFQVLRRVRNPRSLEKKSRAACVMRLLADRGDLGRMLINLW